MLYGRSSGRRNSGELARRRILSVLVADKTGLSSGITDMICNDVVSVLSRYMEFDPAGVEVRAVRFSGSGICGPAVTVTVPVHKFAGLRNE